MSRALQNPFVSYLRETQPFSRFLWVAAIAFGLVSVSGCELGFLGEGAVGADTAAALEGVEGAGFAADGAVADEAAMARSGVYTESVVGRWTADWGSGRAANADLSGTLVENAESLARQSIGAEPKEGIVEHFDMNRKYLGKTIVTERGGVTFDAHGVQTGYLKRFSERTNLWDLNKRFRGSTEQSAQITHIRDEQGELRGYSKRDGSIIKTYNETNSQVGYSKITPLTQRAYAAIPVPLGGGYVSVPRTIMSASAPYRQTSALKVSNGHFEFFDCCVLRVIYRLENPESSVPFRTGMGPRVNPYVGTPENVISGTALQFYPGSGDISFSLDPGASTTVTINLPLDGKDLGGAAGMPISRLNVFGCRLMRQHYPDWKGFTYGDSVIVFPLPC